jgi:glycosyltransferase involved in cell wall biosynthesis
VPPRDPRSLAHAIEEAIGALSTSRRTELGFRARKRIADNFTIEKMVDAYLHLWEKVAATDARAL